MWTRWDYGLLFILILLCVLVFIAKSKQPWSSARCQAAQATVFAEMDLIAEAGKLPSGETANRWRVLMGGC